MQTKITRITLQGFKSFNKKVSIPFYPGITIVCGPNGVGKSNVVDAICFVLGRTSAKSLRADRLYELIFHGYGNKKPAAYASVTLYLDNSNKIFPFEEEEISVQRKVNPKGVCTYKLNGRTVTREKILQVLSIARIHPEGHNIILQGDITQIIEMSPIERREIIDEISGIAEYNEKKARAMRDLEAVDARLREAEIIVNQRYEIFKKLEEERNAALKYQQLQKQLQLLKASLAFRKLNEAEKKFKKIIERIEEKNSEVLKIQKEVESIEKEIEEREKELGEIGDKILQFSKEMEKEREASQLRATLLIKRDRLNACKREIERLDDLITRLEQMKRDVSPILKTISDSGIKGVYGSLRELMSVPDEFRVAILSAAGSHLNDIIVENEETAISCIKELKKKKMRGSFIPLNKISPKKLESSSLLKKRGVIGIASQLVKFDKKFSKAIEFVLGNTLVVKDLNVAKRIGVGKVRMVTLEGDLVERSGLITGGYFPKKERVGKVEGDIQKYKELKEELKKEEEVLKKEINELKEKLSKVSQTQVTIKFVELGKKKVDLEKEIKRLKDRRKFLYERRIKLQNEFNRLSIQKAKVEAEVENMKIEVKQYEGIQIIDQSARVLENQIQKTYQELESLGPVNFKAIEEYEKFKGEFDEYRKKYEKILEERKAVMEMIEKIEEKRREIFNKCLSELSSHFDEIFRIMTGGSAKLELENPFDLDSGLIIQATPAGKKLISIDAMSGGEKTLTAIAFILAVQRYRPAPFYILDEIDAALDKENTKRVAELIKKFSKDAQFIIITHNEQMIKCGDVVYGVTMEEGESKILSIKMPGE